MATKTGPKKPRKSDGYPDYVKEILDQFEPYLFDSPRRTVVGSKYHWTISWSNPPLDASKIAMLIDMTDEANQRIGPGQYGAQLVVEIRYGKGYWLTLYRSRWVKRHDGWGLR